MIGELLYWIGDERIVFASDYAIWQPKWLVEKFVDFQIPEDMQAELGTISDDQKARILGLNAAKLYDIEVPENMQVAGEPEEIAVGSEPVAPA
jgi:predicted TIM-barrel fold metal-dependent hydrolase